MKYYVLAEMDLTDGGWVTEYVQIVTKMIEERGGRYLARTSRVEKLEGERPVPQVVLLIEWPSREVAMAFYESEEYRPYRDSRIGGSRTELALIAGEDVTRAAKIAE